MSSVEARLALEMIGSRGILAHQYCEACYRHYLTRGSFFGVLI
jgi:hypothetical protein